MEKLITLPSGCKASITSNEVYNSTRIIMHAYPFPSTFHKVRVNMEINRNSLEIGSSSISDVKLTIGSAQRGSQIDLLLKSADEIYYLAKIFNSNYSSLKDPNDASCALNHAALMADWDLVENYVMVMPSPLVTMGKKSSTPLLLDALLTNTAFAPAIDALIKFYENEDVETLSAMDKQLANMIIDLISKTNLVKRGNWLEETLKVAIITASGESLDKHISSQNVDNVLEQHSVDTLIKLRAANQQ